MSSENPNLIEAFNPEVHDSAEIAAAHLMVRQWQESEGQNTFSDILDSQIDLSTIQDTYIAPGGNFFVARQPLTDEIIGFVGLRNNGDGQGTVKRLAVVPDQQGQRIGPALVSELIDWARANGFTHLSLTTGKNEPAREKVYEHAGFVVTGEIPEHDDWVMELDLEQPAADLLFAEPTELTTLRTTLVRELIARSETSPELMARYHELGQEIAEKDDSGRAAVGLIIQMGLIRRDTGNYDSALEDFQDAYNYAVGMGFGDVADQLEELIRSIEAHEPSSEFLVNICQDVLSAEDCADLLAMPFDEALGYAYTLLMESGEVEDPTAFFVEKGLLE